MERPLVMHDKRDLRRPIPAWRVGVVLLVLSLAAAACGGSESDSATAPGSDAQDAGDTAADGNDSDTGTDGSGLDLDLGDPELEEIAGDVLSELDAADNPDPDSPYAGIRIWWESGVEELLPGRVPDNLAPNALDETSMEGPRFEFADGGSSMAGNRLVADTDWMWTISGDGASVSRFDYTTGDIDSVAVADLVPDGVVFAIAGDADGLFVGIDRPTGDDEVVELDPISGSERGRVLLPANDAVPLLTMTANATNVAVGYRDGAADVHVIDRSSGEIAFSVPPSALMDTREPLLTDDELLVVEGGDTMHRYSLPDGDLLDEGIALPTRGPVRVFGNDVFQQEDGASRGDRIFAIEGDHAELIVGALADVWLIDSVLIGDGFAVVSGCCGLDEYDEPGIRLFVIDLGSGEVVLTSGQGGVALAPAPG
ncbi:MAG: hypothetical protein RIB98_04530 [Acidimicrobiales bacterium]